MKNSIYVLTIMVVLLTACKNEKKKPLNKMKMGDSATMKSNKDESRVKKIIDTTNISKNPATSKIIDAYLQIKNALASDNQQGTVKGATALLDAFSKFDMEKLDATTHKKYMDIYENAKEDAEHISKKPIKHQREHFETLSADISDLIVLLGTDKTLYQDFCPMKMASWISEVKEIKNPFFGSKMPECGMVRRKIN